MPTVVDLFCGAGGLSEGFQQAGFESVLASDVDPMALTTFRHNHPGVPVIEADVRSLTKAKIHDLTGLRVGEVDVIAGGPPCQGFSLAGRRLADDPRNRLFLEFARLVRELQPRIVVFENVPGLVSMQSGAVVHAILHEFESSGYACAWRVLNTEEFGVPQARPRFVLLGSASSTPPPFPDPSHRARSRSGADLPSLFSESEMVAPLTVWDALSDLPVITQGEGEECAEHLHCPQNSYQHARRGRRTPGALFNHRATRHSPEITQRYAAIPQGGDASSIPPELRTKKANVFRLSQHEPSRTVTCNHRTDLLHPMVPRGTTVREAARLQSFDDDYRFFGNLTRKAKFVTQDDQVGNAVPPLFAKAIAQTLLRSLTRDTQGGDGECKKSLDAATV